MPQPRLAQHKGADLGAPGNPADFLTNKKFAEILLYLLIPKTRK
jgi:hypothetical protein